MWACFKDCHALTLQQWAPENARMTSDETPVRRPSCPGFLPELSWLLLCLATFFAFLPALSGQDVSGTWNTVKPGVIVESVEKKYDADKAGLQPGDVLLSWKEGGNSGEIQSPVTLDLIDVEQRPRGNVTLIGLRNGTPQSWSLGSRYWGIEARPNLPEELLVHYKEEQGSPDRNKAAEAAERWRKAAVSMPAKGSPELRAWLLLRAANFFDQAKQAEEFKTTFGEATKAASTGPGNDALLLYQWATICDQRGDLDCAAEHYQQAFAESQKAGTELLTAQILTSLGFLEIARSDLAKGEQDLREALRIREQNAPGSFEVAGSLLNMGKILSDRGDVAGAEVEERKGLAMYRKLAPHANAVLIALNNLGEFAHQRGDLDRAEQYYLEALKMKEKSPNDPAVATLSQNLASVAVERGEFEQAETYLQRALTIEKKIASGDSQQDVEPGNATIGSTLTLLGKLALRRGEFDKSEELLNEALAQVEKIAPEGLLSAQILSNLGDVARARGNLAAAANFYRHALTIREKLVPGTAQLAETQADLASVTRQSGQSGAAEDLYKQALETLESQTAHLGGEEDARSDFRAQYERYYKEYIALLMQQKEPATAFYVAERSRGRSLAEMLATRHVDVRKGVDSELLEEELRVQDLLRSKINTRVRLLSGQHSDKQIQDIENDIATLLRQREEVEGRIRTSSPAYAALTQPQPLNVKEVQHLLPEGVLLLEYSLGEERSYVFALTSDSFTSYELPKCTEIEREAGLLYHLLTERGHPAGSETIQVANARMAKADAEAQTVAHRLSQMVLRPVANELQGKKLLIVSDGALQYVPFAALPAPEVMPRRVSKPLLLYHEIVNLPSASVLALLRQPQRSNAAARREVAVFADPVFDVRDARLKATDELKEAAAQDGQQDDLENEAYPKSHDLARSMVDTDLKQSEEIHLPRLAFTREEAQEIAAAAPPDSTMQALDFNASRSLAMSGEMAQYRVLHFATHALLNNVHPELSGLVLSLVDSQGQPVDGFLSLEDVYNLNLSADLVVLSACQTALGKAVGGEGMIGLTRGFMYAGSSRVLASLWNVNDFATAKLMTHFYRAMERNGMKPAQALREAQLALWRGKNSAAPYFWAGFVLQGDW